MQQIKCHNGTCVDLAKSSLGRAIIGFNENKFDRIEVKLLEQQLTLTNFKDDY